MNKKGEWKIDTSDPLSQAMKVGDWLKADHNVDSSDIVGSVAVTSDIIKKVVQQKSISDIKFTEEKITKFDKLIKEFFDENK